MRIALTCNNYPPEFRGGTERVVQALAHGLQDAGDEVLVVSGTEDLAKDGHAEDDDGVPVLRIALREDEGYGVIEVPFVFRLDRDFVVGRAWQEASGAVLPADVPVVNVKRERR